MGVFKAQLPDDLQTNKGAFCMTTNPPNWTDTLVHLLALASKLEDEGQYNLAKLARAAADSLGRQAAYQTTVPAEAGALASDLQQTAAALAGLDVAAELCSALAQGAEVMAGGGAPLFALIPHPYICRTCGHLLLSEPAANCPICGAWPQTYQRFLPNYWFDALEPLAAQARLRQTPLEVAALLEGLSEAQLSQTPAGGGWAIRNVLVHLRDAQEVLAYRLELFLAQEHPLLEAKAVWAWATNEAERPPSAQEIFQSYQVSRADTLAKLARLPWADWWRSGWHQEFGEVTLRQQVSYFAAHELTHLSQIAALR
jgi:uncharacterized damage-inducible protein DinB